MRLSCLKGIRRLSDDVGKPNKNEALNQRFYILLIHVLPNRPQYSIAGQFFPSNFAGPCFTYACYHVPQNKCLAEDSQTKQKESKPVKAFEIPIDASLIKQTGILQTTLFKNHKNYRHLLIL